MFQKTLVSGFNRRNPRRLPQKPVIWLIDTLFKHRFADDMRYVCFNEPQSKIFALVCKRRLTICILSYFLFILSISYLIFLYLIFLYPSISYLIFYLTIRSKNSHKCLQTIHNVMIFIGFCKTHRSTFSNSFCYWLK